MSSFYLSFYLLCMVYFYYMQAAEDYLFNTYVTPSKIVTIIWDDGTASGAVKAWRTVVTWYSKIYHDLSTDRAIHAYAHHCMIVDEHFLSHLRIQQESGCLVYTRSDVCGEDMVGLVNFFDYMEDVYGVDDATQWYAFYFDCLSHLFLNELCRAATYYGYKKTVGIEHADYWYNAMIQALKNIRSFNVNTRYARQLSRYRELLDLARLQ